MKLKPILTFFLLGILHIFSYAQLPAALTMKIVSLQAPDQEKIFVHSDRAAYLTGETLWFKIYLVNAQNHIPSTLSKVAYFEVLDTDDVPVLQTKVEIESGAGYGSLFIPASLNSGNYRICSYTQWMRNEGAQSFYYQDITLINPFKKITKTKPAQSVVINSFFFPEGGDLIDEVSNHVAVRVINDQGLGVNYKGVILSEADTILKFQSKRFGLSSFNLTPHNNKYKALIKPDHDKWKEVVLPTIKPLGMALHVKQKNDSLEIIVYSKNLDRKNYYFAAHQRGIIKFSGMLSGKEYLHTTIPIKELGFGVNTISVFDSNFEPICERLYFRRPKNEKPVDLQLSALTLSVRKNIQVKILPTTQIGKMNLSASVFKDDGIAQFTKQQINQYFLMNADLKGVVESPEYYFTNETAESDSLLDLVMLSHGWSRFVKDNSTANPTKQYIPELSEHIIHGLITDKEKKAAKGITTYLASPSKNIRVYPSVSNADGEVLYEMKSFKGVRKIIVQTDFRKDSTYELQILSPFSKSYSEGKKYAFGLSPELSTSIAERSVGMQSISIYNKEIEPKNSEDSTAFYGQPDEAYRLDDYTRFPVLEEVLREYVSGLWVRKKNDKFNFLMPDIISNNIFENSPFVILDGVPVFSINRLLEMDALKIKEIDLVRRKYFLNGITFNGLASFQTYNGDLGGFTIDPKALILDYDGMQIRKEFYVPIYDSPEKVRSRIPDRRSLLLWNPEIVSSQKGELSFDFYTSDIKGKFVIDVQGIDDLGNPISANSSFTIK